MFIEGHVRRNWLPNYPWIATRLNVALRAFRFPAKATSVLIVEAAIQVYMALCNCTGPVKTFEIKS